VLKSITLRATRRDGDYRQRAEAVARPLLSVVAHPQNTMQRRGRTVGTAYREEDLLILRCLW